MSSYILPFCNQYIVLLVIGAILGINTAPYEVGLSKIVGDMLPMEKAPSAFGKLALAKGLGSIVGPSLAGFIYDRSKDHKVVLFLAAIGFFVGGVTFCISAYLHKKRKKKCIDPEIDN